MAEPVWRRPVVDHLGLGERVGVCPVAARKRLRRLRAAAWVWLFRGPELHWDATSDFSCGPGIAIDIGDQREELLLELAQSDSILRPFGARDRWLDFGEINV